jgi:hypothetical protein
VNERFWLQQLPSTDPAFKPLHQAEDMLQETADLDFPILERAHKQAVDEAAFGRSLHALDVRAEELRATAQELRAQDMREGGHNAAAVHAAEVTALGYALGVTAVRVAIREHTQHDMGAAA